MSQNKKCKLEMDDDSEFNLKIHATVNRHALLLLSETRSNEMKQIYHPSKLQAETPMLEKNIQYAWDHLFSGCIREFENKENIYIPIRVANSIKKWVKVGAADFMCEEEIEYLIFHNDSEYHIRCSGKIQFVRDDVLVRSTSLEEYED